MNWHPIAVHFPLALLVTAALALTAAGMKPLQRFAPVLATVGTCNLILAAIAALFALGTGLAAVLHLQLVPAARIAVALHVQWAMFGSVGLLLLAAWRGAADVQTARPSAFFLFALWVVTAALVVAGYRGGENVYRYGIGVAANASAGAVLPQGTTHE